MSLSESSIGWRYFYLFREPSFCGSCIYALINEIHKKKKKKLPGQNTTLSKYLMADKLFKLDYDEF